MNQAAVSLSLFVLEEAIKASPALASAVRELFRKENPTEEDWNRIRERIAAKSYEDFVPTTALKNQ